MHISKVSLSSYRSYGQPIQEYIGRPGLNVVVGENNTGKSSIFSAIRDAARGSQMSPNDKPWGSVAMGGHTDVTLSLSDEESSNLFQVAFFPAIRSMQANGIPLHEAYVHQLKQQFCREVVFRVGGQVRLGGYLVAEDWLEITKENAHVALYDVLTGIRGEGPDPTEMWKKRVGYIHVGVSNLDRKLIEQFQARLKVFADIRSRPRGQGSNSANVEESLAGDQTADLLMNLKIGSAAKRDKYRRIQQRFSTFFPSLELEVAGEQGGAPSIVFNRKGYSFDIPQHQTGTGVFEILTIIANLEDREGDLLVIEEPGAHLHPQGQRALHRLILESAKINQIFVLTHSTEFVNWANIDGITRVWMKDEASQLSRISDDLTENERAALKEALRDIHKREMLFARAVLLVEGETEQDFLEVVAPRLGINLDVLGISVVSVDGEDSYMPFIKYLDALQIPFRCLRDNGPGGSAPQFQARFRFAGGEFEEVISSAGYAALLKDPEAGRSKVRKGRYIGEKIEIQKIPKVYIEVLGDIKAAAKG